MKGCKSLLTPLVVLPSGSFAPVDSAVHIENYIYLKNKTYMDRDITPQPNRINAELQARPQCPSFQRRLESSSFTYLLLLLFTLLIMMFSTLSAETLATQSFESTPADTWTYTSDPTPSRFIWWGPTTENMGGVTAYNGSTYWGSWDVDDQECTLTFPGLALPVGYTYTLSFWYFTKNLSTTTDFCRYSVMYDTGTTWSNWVTVGNSTNAWTQVLLAIPAGSNSLRLRLSSRFNGTTKYAHWDYVMVERTPTPPVAPVVSNVTFSQRIDGSGLVDVYYDLFDGNGDACTIDLHVSADGGATYDVTPTPANLSGELGANITNGTGKHIVWNADAEPGEYDNNQYKLWISADDGTNPIPANFVLVEGGTFNNGTSNVTVSSFYLDKFELTQSAYQDVMGVNPATGYGVGSNYPVYFVSWYNAIEYCNRRSIIEGMTPCYSYSSYGTNPNTWPAGWNTIATNHTNVSCNWTANGYRMPTEAEWEFAARGGNQTHNYNYSGSNDPNAVAWNSYNDSTTHTVGTKVANELGLYDLSGNVWEWNWDIYSTYLGSAQTNPHGGESESYRVLRGGCWNYNASICTVSDRNYTNATLCDNYIGIRLCRSENNFVLVDGGTFNNGTSAVTVSSFYMDKFELTQNGYKAVMGTNPSFFPTVDNAPVEQVSWFNAIEYCNKRSMQEGLTPCYSYSTYGTNPVNWPVGWNTLDTNHTNVACNWTANGYRLPTEAEWEFAARGGNLAHNYTYSGSYDLDAVAWYNSNSGNTTHTVGTKTANELGLFDLSGNVWEWNWDIYGTYPSGSQTNPRGSISGSTHSLRGGSWYYYAFGCSISDRSYGYAAGYNTYIGLRCVRNAP